MENKLILEMLFKELIMNSYRRAMLWYVSNVVVGIASGVEMILGLLLDDPVMSVYSLAIFVASAFRFIKTYYIDESETPWVQRDSSLSIVKSLFENPWKIKMQDLQNLKHVVPLKRFFA